MPNSLLVVKSMMVKFPLLKVLSTKNKWNNHFVEIHKDPKSLIIWCGSTVALKRLWQEIQANKKLQQKQEVCVWHASPHEELLAWEGSSLISTLGGRRRGRVHFWPAQRRGQTSFTISIENVLCLFLILKKPARARACAEPPPARTCSKTCQTDENLSSLLRLY